MEQYRLFLDDIRDPAICTSYMYKRIGKDNFEYLEEWVVVRSYEEFVDTVLELGVPYMVSFDHDLAQEHYEHDGEDRGYEEKTGYDAAKWLVEFINLNSGNMPRVFIHSMNPVGVENIKSLFA